MEKNLHNDFFVNIIKNPDNARDFLLETLPSNISSKLDFKNLEFDDTSYIQTRFKEFFSDVVIKSKLDDKNIDIFILVEHKSYLPDTNALFLQILSYTYSMFERDFSDKKDFRLIIPIVFYHGTEKWDIPSEFSNIFSVDDSIKNLLLNFRYILYDTINFNIENSDAFHKNLLLSSSMIALKTAFRQDDLDSVNKIITNLNTLGLLNNFQTLELFLIYIFLTKNLNEDQIIEIVQKQNSEGGSKLLTLEAYFTEKGIEKGIEKGKLEDARNFKKLGVSSDIISKATGLSIKEIEKL